MKKLSVACLLLFVLSYNASAKMAIIPLDELVENSDLVVIGTLQSVSEYTKDGIDHGEGKIVVEKILFGNVKTQYGLKLKQNDELQLKWQNEFVCPRVEHKHAEDEKKVWLLNITETGTVRANYTGRSVPLSELNKVKKILSKRNKDAGTLKTVVIQDTDECARSTDINDVTVGFTADNFQPRKYSLFNALITLLISLGLYWVLYRKRWQI